MKKEIVLGLTAAAFLLVSCGGGEATEETTDTDTTAVVEEVVETVVSNYTIDTAATVINWMNFSGEETDHQGTVKALSGDVEVSVTGDVVEITGGNLVVDMNTISEGSPKLEGHLMAPDFFDVANYATTEFTFDRHENDMVYGSLSVIGKELAVEAPVTVSVEGGLNIEIGDFKLDFSSLEMPFFIEDVKAPVEEQHDPNIGFNGTVVGVMAE